MGQIKDHLSKLEIQITPQQIQQVFHFLTIWETKGTHVLALNSPLLGVHPIHFTDADRNFLFTCFGQTEKGIAQIVRQIAAAGGTDLTHVVRSDPFHIFAAWLMHLGYTQITNTQTRDEFLLAIAKLLHYKFFTSTLSVMFPHKSNESQMRATIESLTRKFDIIIYGTWRKTIEARCKDLLNMEIGLHREAILKAEDGLGSNDGIGYMISDSQTRLREKIKLVVRVYYDIRASGKGVDGRASTGENKEGEKEFLSQTSVIDAILSNITTEVLSVSLFIDRELITSIANQFNNVSPGMLQGVLVNFSEIALTQSRSGDFDKVSKIKGDVIYIGVRKLITMFLQRSYRYCIENHISWSRHAVVYAKIRNAYSASRTADDEVLVIKASLERLVNAMGPSKRPTTLSSIRLAVLLYILARSFKYS